MMHFKKNIYITFIENSCKLKHVMMGRCIKYMNCVTFKRDICFWQPMPLKLSIYVDACFSDAAQ